MGRQGWIKLHRQVLDNPVVCKDSEYFAVWCYLLLEATHQDKSIVFNGKRITLQPGQLITGRKSVSEKFNIEESKVQRILKTLESEHQIEQQTSNKNRLITIVNWQMYQESEQQNEQQVNNKCTTSEQQVNTNKNVKNEKNEKNEKKKKTSCPKEPGKESGRFDAFWAVYPRKTAKAAASKAWNKIKPDEELTKTIVCAVEKQKSSEQWRRDNGQYIPYPATWLNGRRWEDDGIIAVVDEAKEGKTHEENIRDAQGEWGAVGEWY